MDAQDAFYSQKFKVQDARFFEMSLKISSHFIQLQDNLVKDCTKLERQERTKERQDNIEEKVIDERSQDQNTIIWQQNCFPGL